jgi:Uma2 family endonuclease
MGMFDTPTKHKFTVASLVLMEEAGILPPDHRTELLNGELIDMSPIKAPHAYCVTQLTRFFYQHLSANEYLISVQNPVQLSEYALPQPDVVVAHYRAKGYFDRHIQPSDVALLVEVADSTYRYDRHTKLSEYAAAGVPEYWIVNINERQLEVYTQPEGNYYKQAIIEKYSWVTALGPTLAVETLFS